MLCQRLESCTLNIYSQRKHVYYFYCVLISHVCLGLHCFVLYHCFILLYLFISCLLFGFLFFLVFINTYLQQSTCIMFISRIVGFALSYCLLSFYYLLWSFPFIITKGVHVRQMISLDFEWIHWLQWMGTIEKVVNSLV
jgi:hypothetical protein